MTDAEIEAFGQTMEEAFENAGKAVEDLMVDLHSVKPLEAREIHLEEKDLGSLLYSWIESLIAFQDSDGLLFSKFSCRISKNSGTGYSLMAKLSGEKFDPQKHEQKTAIKAPTYHDMKISEGPKRVTLRFLVDL
jgi:SHS2 domain-containing protein